MTQEEYLRDLASQVDPALEEKFRDWPDETRMYMYLHNIQLAHMARFEQLLKEQTIRIAALNKVNAVSTTWIEP
ncbi:hypothetical protein [Haliscomenobacter sp.]|uniref:hypothetical protein n=1 Tax=Haliscomenobacter sp. TaxID=2717303 RepID=UPI003364E951